MPQDPCGTKSKDEHGQRLRLSSSQSGSSTVFTKKNCVHKNSFIQSMQLEAGTAVKFGRKGFLPARRRVHDASCCSVRSKFFHEGTMLVAISDRAWRA